MTGSNEPVGMAAAMGAVGDCLDTMASLSRLGSHNVTVMCGHWSMFVLTESCPTLVMGSLWPTACWCFAMRDRDCNMALPVLARIMSVRLVAAYLPEVSSDPSSHSS